LRVGYTPGADWDNIVLTFNHDLWEAKKYTRDFRHNGFDPVHPIKQFTFGPKISFEHIFILLIENDIFNLPDQGVLKYEDQVQDGNGYLLTFKIGSKFGRYSFYNPAFYKNYYPNIKEFDYYSKIAEIFNSEFVERK